MGRSPCCEKTHINKGAWTKEEDQRLINYIRNHGEGCWRSLPQAAGLHRCGKSCRLRWINYLRPDLKRGNFTEEEDKVIIKLHGLLGNKWSLIAGRLPGRTDNEIKNYWNTHIKRKLISHGINPQSHRPISATSTATTATPTTIKTCLDFTNSSPQPSKVTTSLINSPTKNIFIPTTYNYSSSVDDTKCNSSTTEESQPPPSEKNVAPPIDLELSIGLPFQSKCTKSTSFDYSSSSKSLFDFLRPAPATDAAAKPFSAAAVVAQAMCPCKWQLGLQKGQLCNNCQPFVGLYRYIAN
ncbi:hypothetical protein RD792_000706 [Penstemon davidsonii]|uniref:Uncharacterized protein n=1 Tax=Penstemon davidsonii TaxID=160366 RepID=A0ABR0DLE6_9LAMI|nr:hypothetical protein RD792_000706 [Penstemon davidsonii]